MIEKERYKWLKLLDALFPQMVKRTPVKVLDKRFTRGYYYGFIYSSYLSDFGPFRVYVVQKVIDGFWIKKYWVYRDKIEVLPNGIPIE